MLTTNSFAFTLPDALIAKYPTQSRTASRLLCLDKRTGEIQHKNFTDIVGLIKPGDLLVLNNTKVMPARIFGHKLSGGKVELLIEKINDPHTAIAFVKSSKPVKPGAVIKLGPGGVTSTIEITIIERLDSNDGRHLIKARDTTNFKLSIADILTNFGHMPLPPYMKREAEIADSARYQTVYSKELGSVAAPTAGLHFDTELLQALIAKGVGLAEVTLHIGSGTFQPVRVTNIADHQMHAEWLTVSQKVCDKIAVTKANGGRVFAVGTTVTRAIETAALAAAATQEDSIIQSYSGDTKLFITPGFDFKVIDGMITNFHLPCSTLLMLVCALAGKDNVLNAYAAAVQHGYRFYSYGDAMLVSSS